MYMYMYSQFEFVNAYDHKRLFKSLVFLSIKHHFSKYLSICVTMLFTKLCTSTCTACIAPSLPFIRLSLLQYKKKCSIRRWSLLRGKFYCIIASEIWWWYHYWEGSDKRGATVYFKTCINKHMKMITMVKLWVPCFIKHGDTGNKDT